MAEIHADRKRFRIASFSVRMVEFQGEIVIGYFKSGCPPGKSLFQPIYGHIILKMWIFEYIVTWLSEYFFGINLPEVLKSFIDLESVTVRIQDHHRDGTKRTEIPV